MNLGATDRAGVAVFAKAPVAGFAKTRLIPLLGPQGAADLQSLLIGLTLRLVHASPLRPISLWCAPDRSHNLFHRMKERYGLDLHDQAGEDLGSRMLLAFEVLTRDRPLLLIGTDCPALTPAHLIRCAQALRDGADAAFVPAEDGGYALIGLRKAVPQLFDKISWGTESVMEQTRRRLRSLQLRHFETATLWDVDTPADYERARAAGLLQLD
ncbi:MULTISPECIES: TIGR04282 family arsenosugar biosynthesis glycosyltransferase [unclassified Afipia]|nr:MULTISPECIES: TIGR04282 family arsenosugar biosynthesis glycosyltransferase [unclassified Afipia]